MNFNIHNTIKSDKKTNQLLIFLDFRTVGDIIRNDLSSEEKERLQEHIINAVRQLHPADAVMLLPLIMNTPSLQEAALKTAVTFITNEMRYAIVN